MSRPASVRRLAALLPCIVLLGAAVGTACSSDNSTGSSSVSLAGTYTLKSFTEAGQDLSQAASGTAVLTATTYKVNITFLGNVAPAIVDSGTYTATGSGTFTESSLVTGAQATGTYTLNNGLWGVNVTSQGVTIAQTWQKQ
jgi:hypothetical protein